MDGRHASTRPRLTAVALVACAGLLSGCDSGGTDGDADTSISFKHKDWQQLGDGEEFEPVPLVCAEGCAGGAPCIETPDGAQCAQPCTGGDCPAGFDCLLLPEGSFCVARHARLCMPCRLDAECASPGAESEPRCWLKGEGQGSFCTIPCSTYFPCPDGYVCEDRGWGKECYPADGECACSALAATLGAETDCFIPGMTADCAGLIACTLGGLQECSAKVPEPEVCNGKDDDCDGAVDEDFLDVDANGIADCFEERKPPDPTKPDADKDGDPDETDCAPKDPSMGHGAAEVCNGKDDNCNGVEDEGFADLDEDSTPDCLDNDDDGDSSPDDEDCAPLDHTVSPKNAEVCNGKDDNCNGLIDEDTGDDSDGDGLPDCLDDDDDGDGVPDASDCGPLDKGIRPGALETCNGKDDDCDGVTDPEGTSGCIPFHKDADGDGTAGDEAKCLCSPQAPYLSENAGDCNDGDPGIKPGAAEVCNGKDDNCDGNTDPPGTCETIRKICVDPGDGGTSPGAVGIVTEKDINLAMGLKLRDWLKADTQNTAGGGAWTVLMTRESDKSVSLEDRVAYANSNGAERFVSIHNNSCGGCGGTGTETFVKPGADGTTNDLAGLVQGKIVQALGLKNRGNKVSDFYVLTHTNMPALITFPGFVDTQGDVNVIGNGDGQSKVGKAILHALQKHFGAGEFTP
jgi:N-acetylmuramoyl-L-alanine amidase